MGRDRHPAQLLTGVCAGAEVRDAPDVIDGIDDDGWACAVTRARGEVELPGRAVLDAYTRP